MERVKLMPVKVIEEAKCIHLLENAVYGRLATCGNDRQPYITPVNFILHDNKIYFHTGFQGRKLDNIAENKKVCLEISGSGKLYATPHARNFTMRYWSVLVFGKAVLVHDAAVKLEAMNLLMQKYAARHTYEPLSPEDMKIVNVIEISIDEMSGKASIDPYIGCKQ